MNTTLGKISVELSVTDGTAIRTTQITTEKSGSRKLNFWKNFEFANALMDVAAYFPFRQGTFEFELKPFLKEVQHIADERYGGKFT